MLAWSITGLVWLALLLAISMAATLGPGPVRLRLARVVSVRLEPLEVWPAPAPEPPPPPVRGRSGAVGAVVPGSTQAGGSFGQHTLAAPSPADPFTALPSRVDPGSLADLAPAATLVAASREQVVLPPSGKPGPGQGRGKGTGVGDGIGSGQGGQGGRGGSRRADYARLAASARPLDPEDYVVTRQEMPHYVMTEVDSTALYGSTVVVRMVLGSNGVPLFQEPLSGPEVLYPATMRAAIGWRFALSARVRALAPVVVLVRFRFQK